MALVVTKDGPVEESTLTWKLWREDKGDSWLISHELSDADGNVVRLEEWNNVKGEGFVEDPTCCWRVWREDNGDSWSFIHDLTNREGVEVRRDVFVNFKGSGLPAAGTQQGGM